MYIKTGDVVYNEEFGYGVALLDESEHVGAVVKFDTPNKNLVSLSHIFDCLYGLTDEVSYIINLFGNIRAGNDKYGMCTLEGNEKEKIKGITYIEVTVVDNNKNKDKTLSDVVDDVVKKKQKKEETKEPHCETKCNSKCKSKDESECACMQSNNTNEYYILVECNAGIVYSNANGNYVFTKDELQKILDSLDNRVEQYEILKMKDVSLVTPKKKYIYEI